MTIGIGIVEVVLVLFGAVLQQVEEGEGILSEFIDFFSVTLRSTNGKSYDFRPFLQATIIP